MTPREFNSFRRSTTEFAESQFLFNRIDSSTYDRPRSWAISRVGKDYARRLFDDRFIEVPEFKLRLQLKTLREMDGGEFQHIEVLFGQSRKRRKKRCFVGHRFTLDIENTLRWNLRQVLEPYRIQLDWSGRDMASVQILEDIVKKIRRADFCVFDNRGAKGKPNVYIEAGMCIAIKKPFVLFQYAPRRKDVDDPGPIPSDLGFALSLRYRNYEQLFQDFYFRFPLFLERTAHG